MYFMVIPRSPLGFKNIIKSCYKNFTVWKKKPEPYLDVSTPQGPHLHLDLPGQQEPVMTLDVSIPHGPELHLDVAAQQEPFADFGRANTS
jgi:hypothetical protein